MGSSWLRAPDRKEKSDCIGKWKIAVLLLVDKTQQNDAHLSAKKHSNPRVAWLINEFYNEGREMHVDIDLTQVLLIPSLGWP